MLTFKDFVPEIQKRVLGMATAYESIHEVLTRVNRWLEHDQIELFNVETLLLPEHPGASAENPPARMVGSAHSSSTLQIIRVWYRDHPATVRPYTGITTELDATDLTNAP